MLPDSQPHRLLTVCYQIQRKTEICLEHHAIPLLPHHDEIRHSVVLSKHIPPQRNSTLRPSRSKKWPTEDRDLPQRRPAHCHHFPRWVTNPTQCTFSTMKKTTHICMIFGNDSEHGFLRSGVLTFFFKGKTHFGRYTPRPLKTESFNGTTCHVGGRNMDLQCS